MLTEITGPPGVGKSFFCDKARIEGRSVFPGLLEQRFWFLLLEILLLPLSLLMLPPGTTLYIARCSASSDRRWRFKLNVFRNVLKKIIRFKILRSTGRQSAVVDEGISHTPFLFMFVGKEEYEEFFKHFEVYLEKVEIVIMLGTAEILESRLKSKGHKRLDGRFAPRLVDFVADNMRVQEAMVANYIERLPNCSVIDLMAPISPESVASNGNSCG
jgi:hypothetical protein